MTTVSRRERVRADTVAEIKDRAWTLMADSGAEAMSLRAVARQMGMAPSALYRYFPSRDELLTELIVDGYESLAAAVEDAYADSRRRGTPPGACDTFVEVAHAYRRWALSHPTQYGLIFSSTVPGYSGNERTTAASFRSADVLLQIMGDMVDEGEARLDEIAATLPHELEGRLRGWSENGGHGLPVAALAAAMWSYTTLHGAINLEVNGHLPPPLLGSEELFESALRNLVDSLVRRT